MQSTGRWLKTRIISSDVVTLTTSIAGLAVSSRSRASHSLSWLTIMSVLTLRSTNLRSPSSAASITSRV